MKLWEAVREMEENGKVCTWGNGEVKFRRFEAEWQSFDARENSNWRRCNLAQMCAVFAQRDDWRVVDKWKMVEWWEMVKWMGENRGKHARYRHPRLKPFWITTCWPKNLPHEFSSEMTEQGVEFQIPND